MGFEGWNSKGHYWKCVESVCQYKSRIICSWDEEVHFRLIAPREGFQYRLASESTVDVSIKVI